MDPGSGTGASSRRFRSQKQLHDMSVCYVTRRCAASRSTGVENSSPAGIPAIARGIRYCSAIRHDNALNPTAVSQPDEQLDADRLNRQFGALPQKTIEKSAAANYRPAGRILFLQPLIIEVLAKNWPRGGGTAGQRCLWRQNQIKRTHRSV